MKKTAIVIGLLLIVGTLLAHVIVLLNNKALVFHPRGIIAQEEFNLIITNIILMLIIILPTMVILLWTVWKYRSDNPKTEYAPERTIGPFKEVILWIIPAIIVVIMASITFNATHKLDPYRPLEGEGDPLTIQVVALDWKWLFIYPEQQIATLNFVQFPDKTPIKFELSADGSPMNSFWVPQLSGQIYCMTGMITLLHIMANDPGEYNGRAAEINGEGYSDMTFIAKSTSKSDFDEWVAYVKQSPLALSDQVYTELVKPSVYNPITLYSSVKKDFFQDIVTKYMHPKVIESWKATSTEDSH